MHAPAKVHLPFLNRVQAGQQLAEFMVDYRGRHPLVLAIPRGAVPIGRVVADQLHGDLDVVLAHKLGAPWNPELAVGAVDEAGHVYVSDNAAAIGADEAYLEQEAAAQMKQLRRRRRLFTPDRAPLDAKGRLVIVVDDGLATGATMIAALHAVRGQAPAHLVCAVPVSSKEALEAVSPLADEMVCLAVPTFFGGVGRFYFDFTQVEDDEVVAALRA